jgi:hypothetical protein
VYVLDGQELLPCAQALTSPGCLAGGTHATKQESYSKIKLASNVWSVWSRSGVRTDLEAVYQVASGTWRWGQKRVVDAHSNTATYTWECVGGTAGDCYPKSVSYGPFVITLYRQAAQRPDVLSFATGGLSGLGKTLYRLGSVVVARGTTMIRAYRLSYAPSTATSRSLLTEVQQFGTDASVSPDGVITGSLLLPAQTFSYQAAQ